MESVTSFKSCFNAYVFTDWLTDWLIDWLIDWYYSYISRSYFLNTQISNIFSLLVFSVSFIIANCLFYVRFCTHFVKSYINKIHSCFKKFKLSVCIEEVSWVEPCKIQWRLCPGFSQWCRDYVKIDEIMNRKSNIRLLSSMQ